MIVYELELWNLVVSISDSETKLKMTGSVNMEGVNRPYVNVYMNYCYSYKYKILWIQEKQRVFMAKK